MIKKSTVSMILVMKMMVLTIAMSTFAIGCGFAQPQTVAVVEQPVISAPKISDPMPQMPGEEVGISVDVTSTGGAELSYIWAADGGEIVRGQGSPAITYRVPDEPGTYNVRLRVEWDGQSVEQVTTIKVEEDLLLTHTLVPTDTPADTVTPIPTITVQPSSTPEPVNTIAPPTQTPTSIPTPTKIPTNTPRPEPADMPLPSTFNINVPGNVVWLDTGIDIRSGYNIMFSASGTVNSYGGEEYSNSDPNGQVDADYYCEHVEGARCLLSGTPFGALVGKIGGSSAFFVGTYKEINSQNDGRLYLAVNDYDVYFGDNSGVFAVTITVK